MRFAAIGEPCAEALGDAAVSRIRWSSPDPVGWGAHLGLTRPTRCSVRVVERIGGGLVRLPYLMSLGLFECGLAVDGFFAVRLVRRVVTGEVLVIARSTAPSSPCLAAQWGRIGGCW